MALNARLEMRQGQGLVITPQLQQAIKLLQLSNIELDAYVDGELEKNPLLARDDRDADTGSDEAPAALHLRRRHPFRRTLRRRGLRLHRRCGARHLRR